MPKQKTRNVSLTPGLETFIDGCVATGRFRSASEVVRAGLRLLEEDERKRGAPRRPAGVDSGKPRRDFAREC